MACENLGRKIARYGNAIVSNFRHFHSVCAARAYCLRADVRLRIAIMKVHLKHAWHEFWR